MNHQQAAQKTIPETIPETGVTIAKRLPRSRAGVPGGLQETGAFHTRFSHVPIPDAALVPGTSARKRGALPRLALQAPPSETVGREELRLIASDRIGDTQNLDASGLALGHAGATTDRISTPS